MKNIAIIKNMKGEIIEQKNFASYVAIERYVAKKYDNKIYDWNWVEKVVEKRKGDFEKENGIEQGLQFAKVHTIVIREGDR